ncbi:hypothetical protein ACFWF3_20835 [Nocardia sp. NPDC060220]|uniref:hypothetical protein n=1 Tax=Nocardia sp. NPDC060220 TaxID=3347076 RepID=UPI0036511F97
MSPLLPELLPELPKSISADATPVVAVVAATAITAMDNRRGRIRMGGNAFHCGERQFRYVEEPEFGVSRLTEAAICPNQRRGIPFIGSFRALDRAGETTGSGGASGMSTHATRSPGRFDAADPVCTAISTTSVP